MTKLRQIVSELETLIKLHWEFGNQEMQGGTYEDNIILRIKTKTALKSGNKIEHFETM